MASIKRNMFDAATSNVDGVFVPGFRAVASGNIDVFFPDVQKGAVGITIMDSAGKETTIAEGSDWVTAEGITIQPMTPPIVSAGHQLMKVTTTGTVGLSRINRVLLANDDNTNVGILNRLSAIEQELGGSTGPGNDPRFTVGVAVADPAATTSAALTNPADNADAAALVAWAKTVVTNFNAVRTTNSNVRTSVINLITSLENGGFLTK